MTTDEFFQSLAKEVQAGHLSFKLFYNKFIRTPTYVCPIAALCNITHGTSYVVNFWDAGRILGLYPGEARQLSAVADAVDKNHELRVRFLEACGL